MLKKKIFNLQIGIFLILSILPFLYHLDSTLFQTNIHSLYSESYSFDQISTWSSANLGKNTSSFLWRFASLELIFSLILKAGISSSIATHLFLSFLFLVGLVSMNALLKKLFRNSTFSTWVFVPAAIFYVYNLYTLNLISGDYALLIPHLFLPLQTLLFLKGVELKQKRYLIYFVFLSIPIFGINLVYDVILFFLITLVLFLFYGFDVSKLKFLVATLFFTIAMHLWWLVPMFYGNLTNIENSNKILQSEDFYNNDTDVLNVFRNMGDWAFFTSSRGIPNKSYANFYKTDFLPISFFIPLALLVFLVSVKGAVLDIGDRRRISLIFLILVILLAFIGGTHRDWPTSDAISFFFKKIPFAQIFRNTYKWTSAVIFLTSLLIAYMGVAIYGQNKKRFYFFCTVSLFVIILNVSPLLTGEFLNEKYLVKNIPKYWYEMAAYVNERYDPTTNRILLLPDQYFTAFNWENSFKLLPGNIADDLFKVPSVYNTCIGCGISYSLNLDSYIFKNITSEKLDRILGLTGITHILQRNDYLYGYYPTQNSKQIKNILNKYSDLYLEKSIEKLDFYSFDSVRPVIYSPKSIFLTDNLDSLLPVVDFLPAADSFVTLDDQRDQGVFKNRITYVGKMLNTASTTVSERNVISEILHIPLSGSYRLAQTEHASTTLDKGFFVHSGGTFIGSVSSDSDQLLSVTDYKFSKELMFESSALYAESFDETTSSWEDAANCRKLKPKAIINASIVEEVGREKVLELSADSDIGCVHGKYIALEPNSYYLLTFDARLLEGQYGYCLSNGAKCISKFVSPEEAKNTAWENNRFLFKNDGPRQGAALYLYASATAYPSIARFDNVSIQKVTNLYGDYALERIDNVTNTSVDSLSFYKTNSTLYEVEVRSKDNFFLNFQESFHPKWRLLLKKEENVKSVLNKMPFPNKSLVDVGQHYVANAYANGWYVDVDALCVQQALCTKNPDGTWNIDMVIEFWPQRWFYLGLGISGLTLAGCLGYLGWSYVADRRKQIPKKEKI